MKRLFCTIVVLSLAAAGCSQGDSSATTGAPAAGGGPSPDPRASDPTGGMVDPSNPSELASDAGESSTVSDAGDGSAVSLTPENTKIEFVGTHTGDQPDPRKGGFGKFEGTATLNESDLTSIKIDIDTASLYTEIEKLTNHLKSPDFFSVREHPKASFETTSIVAKGDGTATITGNLTLLGNTKEISFPATISTEGGDLSLTAEFNIDRTEFGMDYGLDRVEKEVAMTVTVGQ